MKVSVYIATSLDGFIARENGDIDWLNDANSTVPANEDCGYQKFFDSIDLLIMGKNTFQQVLGFGQWPYGDKQVIVLSHHDLEVPSNISKTVSHSSEAPSQLLERLSSQGFKHAYVDGGRTVQGFMRELLVDEMTITTIPLLLGSGISLFGATNKDVKLEHVETTAYDFGFVKSKYKVL